jgi:protein TonB
LIFERSKRRSRAQTVSLIVHGSAVIALLLFASRTIPPLTQPQSHVTVEIGPLLYSPETERLAVDASSGRKAGGGANAQIPATSGFFAPRSPIQLAPPRLPDNMTPVLPVAATILDLDAPAVILPENALGLPWMRDKNDSGGRGSRGGIGDGTDGGMGDRNGPSAGDGESAQGYLRAASLPTCLVCPTPIYTDEARHVKTQGTVTLRVLVGADGKASDIRVIRGPGFGLEERATETVRGWKFNPARAADHQAVAAWVTVEAVFRLF